MVGNLGMETMRLSQMRVEKIGMTSARLIQCPLGIAKLPIEVVKVASNERFIQSTQSDSEKKGKKRYLYPLNQEQNSSKH